MPLRASHQPYAKRFLKPAFIYTGISLLGVAAYGLASLFSLPFVLMAILQAIFVSSLVFLIGISYGILNDMLACRTNLEYFTMGHQPDQHGGVVASNSKNLNAVTWGIVATWDIALPAGILFGIAALATFLSHTALPPFMLAFLGAGALLAVGLAHVLAKYLVGRSDDTMINKRYSNATNSIYGYSSLSPDVKFKRSWLVNGYRNGLGYALLPLMGLLGLIASITLGALHVAPTALHMSMALQYGLAAIPVVIAMVSLLYFAAKLPGVKAGLKAQQRLPHAGSSPSPHQGPFYCLQPKVPGPDNTNDSRRRAHPRPPSILPELHSDAFGPDTDNSAANPHHVSASEWVAAIGGGSTAPGN